ncbi:MAG: restriction endonuclease subunit S [Nanoarchaeota archaeon]
MKTKQLPKNWKVKPLFDYLDYEQPIKYIITTPITNDKTSTPVLTANKGFIKGYTDETEGIYENVPAIIFDDFTTDNKFVNFPFKVKSSAMKILKQKSEDVDLRFIFYQMQMQKVNHTTHKRYYLSTYQNLDFVFPPLPLQKKIVSAIETQFTRLDEAVKSLKAVKQKIQLYRKAVLKKAFEKGEEVELGKIFEIVMGQSPPSEFYNKNKKGLPFFQGKKEFNYKYPNIEIWTEKYNKEAEKGDLLLSIRAPIGPCNIAPERCAIGRGIAAIKANNETESLLLFYLVKFNAQRLDSKGTGTTFKAISKTGLNSFLTNIPPKKDWQKIISSIESSFSVIDKVENIVDNSLKKAEQLRKSILKVAFEGRLVSEGQNI